MKYLSILFLAAATIFVSCEGPVGPQGPQGNPGQQGPQGEPGSEGFTFEYILDFTSPDYLVYLPFPDDFQMLTSDVALVYFLWGTDEIDGETVEIWRALPQTLFLEEGLLQYNYDFTLYDVSVFMDSNFDPSGLGADFTDDWVARVVVVPAQFADNGRIAGVDLTDYNAVKEHFNLKEITVDEKYSSIKRPAIK